MNGHHKFKGFALIVDSIWFLPIMAMVGLAIIYLFDKYSQALHAAHPKANPAYNG